MPSLEGNMLLHSFAPAKVNLTLHVHGRRDDGYHDLESIVAFASEGDGVDLLPGRELSLKITGPAAHGLDAGEDNLVVKAVRKLQERVEGLKVGAFRLDKRLPIASGIGGGSSDAAAALRLVAQVNGLALSDPQLLQAAIETGADVPVCIEPRARLMRGIGEIVGQPLNLPRIAAVLVNPGVAVATSSVFETLGLGRGERTSPPPGTRVPDSSALEQVMDTLAAGRNDLQSAAISLQPEIRRALDILADTTDCLLARMSGSGATVFALYDDFDRAESAAKLVETRRPHWWVRAVWLK